MHVMASSFVQVPEYAAAMRDDPAHHHPLRIHSSPKDVIPHEMRLQFATQGSLNALPHCALPAADNKKARPEIRPRS
jgi:hypothetical protein